MSLRFKEILGLYDTTNVRDGYVITTNDSQELDSATVILPNVEEMSIERNDIIQLNESSYWLVANVHKKYATFTSPYLYNYEIDLVSLTKLLQIPIPSQTITVRDGTSRSVDYYIDNAFNLYFKLRGRYAGMNISNEITYINYNDGQCPEATFSQPTLREYIDYLLNFIEGISYLRLVKTGSGNTASDYTLKLDYIDVSHSTQQIINMPNPTYTIVEAEVQNQSEDYITEISQEMEKVLAPKLFTERIRLKSDAAISNETNAMLYTFHDIYDVKDLHMNFGTDSGNTFYVKVPMDKHVTTPGKIVTGGAVNVYFGRTSWGYGSDYYLGTHYCITTISQDNLIKWESINMNGTRTLNTYSRATVDSSWVLTNTYSVQSDQYLMQYNIIIVRNYNVVDSPSGNTTDDYIRINNGTIDLMPYLQNQSVYDAMNILPGEQTDLLAPSAVVKNNSFAWSRGSNKITNLLKYEQSPGVFGTEINDKFAIEYALRAAVSLYVYDLLDLNLVTEYTYTILDAQDSVYRDYTATYAAQSTIFNSKISSDPVNTYAAVKNWIFTITYKGYANLKLRTGKPNARHIIPMMDSNTNASTDVVESTHVSSNKLQRQAVNTIIFTGYSLEGQTSIYAGMYLLGGYVTSLETKYENGCRFYKGIVMPRGAYFSNDVINREKRYYSLPDPSEAVIRHEVFEKHITAINNVTGKNIKCNYAVVYYKKNGYDSSNNRLWDACILPISEVFGWNRRVTYTVDLQSNSIYGFNASTDTVQGGKKTELFKYTDEFGEVEEIHVVFGYRTDIAPADDSLYDLELAVAGDAYDTAASIYFDSTLPPITLDSHFLKDAREHLVISLELLIDDSDLISDVYNTTEAEYTSISSYNKYTITT